MGAGYAHYQALSIRSSGNIPTPSDYHPSLLGSPDMTVIANCMVLNFGFIAFASAQPVA